MFCRVAFLLATIGVAWVNVVRESAVVVGFFFSKGCECSTGGAWSCTVVVSVVHVQASNACF